MDKRLSIKHALKSGINLVIDHFGFIIKFLFLQLLFAIPSLITLGVVAYSFNQQAPAFFKNIAQMSSPESRLMIIGFTILFLIAWAAAARVSFIRTLLDLYDGKSVELSDVFIEWRKAGNYIVAFLLYISLIILGLVLLIIPGIYCAVIYRYYGIILVEKNCGPLTALRMSKKLVKPVFWNMFKVSVLCNIINSFSTRFLIHIVVWPTLSVANIALYRELDKKEIAPVIQGN